MPVTPELQKYIASALTVGCEINLGELIEALKVEGMLLDQLNTVKQFVSDWSFEIAPPLTQGDFSTPRIMRTQRRAQHSLDTVLQEIRQGESVCREFKSSLLYDYKRAVAVPDTPLPQLKSSAVLFSTLKTIAAFLNSDGGVLFVGVSDSAETLGLANDCLLLGREEPDLDKWHLEVRSQITGKFKDGALINDYVDVSFVESGGKHIARIQILPKKKLSFMKAEEGNGFRLFRRQGNRTMEVLIEEVEDFLVYRRDRS